MAVFTYLLDKHRRNDEFVVSIQYDLVLSQ
jgi:hypothetical protein